MQIGFSSGRLVHRAGNENLSGCRTLRDTHSFIYNAGESVNSVRGTIAVNTNPRLELLASHAQQVCLLQLTLDLNPRAHGRNRIGELHHQRAANGFHHRALMALNDVDGFCESGIALCPVGSVVPAFRKCGAQRVDE